VRSPSSLVFLALLGVWAVYFLRHWVRRREHLATARSVAQFGTAMRVLERREHPASPDRFPGPLQPPTIHPARSSHGRPTGSAGVSHDRALAGVAGLAVADAGRVIRHRADPGHRHPGRPRPGRPVRAGALLLAAVATAALGGLVALSVVPGWAPAAGVGVMLGTFVWTRAAVRAERALARAARRGRAPDRPGRPAPARARAEAARSAAETPGDGAARTPAAGEVYDGERVQDETRVGDEVEVEVELVHLVDEDDIPLTWEPVPVPRPTYTMKARAERAEVTPAPTAPERDPMVTDHLGGRFDEDVRRVAGA
jgi:hypothetical protein